MNTALWMSATLFAYLSSSVSLAQDDPQRVKLIQKLDAMHVPEDTPADQMSPELKSVFNDLLSVPMEDFDTRLGMFDRFLSHPELRPELSRGPGWSGFRFTFGWAIKPDVVKARYDEVVALGEHRPRLFTRLQSEGISEVFGALHSVDSRQLQQIDPFRLATIQAIESALEHDSRWDESGRDAARNQLELLNGTAIRGGLVGAAAPPIEFMWSSTGDIESLEDLRGKTVVLDYWAFWCGPCVKKFPEINEAAKRFADQGVVFIGITAPQGRFPIDGIQRTTPQQEIDAMPAYMRKRNMDWPVAMTSGELFDPRYGVRAIPHLTVISPQGTVLWNGIGNVSISELLTEVLNQDMRDSEPSVWTTESPAHALALASSSTETTLVLIDSNDCAGSLEMRQGALASPRVRESIRSFGPMIRTDPDRASESAALFGVSGSPTMIRYKNGRPVAHRPGTVSEKDLLEWLEAANPSDPERKALDLPSETDPD